MATTFKSIPARSHDDVAARSRRGKSQRVLLACGIGYPVVYIVTNDGIAATLYDGCSRMDQVISELSAKGAPTRPFLASMLPLYTALLMGFGTGVWQSAGTNRALRGTAVVVLACGATGVMWLPFPMTGRAEMAQGAMGSNDVGHLVLSGLTGVTVIALCGFGAAAFGKRFRFYSLATMAVTLAFGGILTGSLSSNMMKGAPTSRIGLFERIGIWAWMSWMAVLAVILLRRPSASPTSLEQNTG